MTVSACSEAGMCHLECYRDEEPEATAALKALLKFFFGWAAVSLSVGCVAMIQNTVLCLTLAEARKVISNP